MTDVARFCRASCTHAQALCVSGGFDEAIARFARSNYNPYSDGQQYMFQRLFFSNAGCYVNPTHIVNMVFFCHAQ